MTRIIWQLIKEKLIFPFVDLDIKYYDLGIFLSHSLMCRETFELFFFFFFFFFADKMFLIKAMKIN